MRTSRVPGHEPPPAIIPRLRKSRQKSARSRRVGVGRDDLAAVLTWALRRAARLRLAESGIDGGRAEGLLDLEPGLGDRWFVYMALAPASIIEDLTRGEVGE